MKTIHKLKKAIQKLNNNKNEVVPVPDTHTTPAGLAFLSIGQVWRRERGENKARVTTGICVFIS